MISKLRVDKKASPCNSQKIERTVILKWWFFSTSLPRLHMASNIPEYAWTFPKISQFITGFQHPFSDTHPLTQLVPFLKALLPLPFFLFHPILRYFRQFPHPHATPFFPNPTHQPSLHIINGFKQISKGWFCQFNCRFLSKINFWFFKSLYKYIIYQVNLIYGILSSSFLDNLEWLFFHKTIVAEKSNFSSNA